ncbi:Ger(x)C family spore germination protein [Caldanaerobius polysaccharolyticus]|uniref:Ger(x)C family spore germination protein n=1 Tax=Caldanaerobius polysaccharolyticus TaxID=44256 RepID=UPI000479574E|nr:Ger(x)C family spore germination protein [Caldanaerobius polysaccharolyticus]
MQKRHKVLCALLIFAVAFAATGCWDKVEIDKRAFVLTMGVDKVEGSGKNIEVFFSFPNLKSYISTPMGGGGKGTPKFTISGRGDSIFDIARSVETRLNDRLYFGHTKVVIFGENILKDPMLFRQVLDELERYHEFSRKVNVVCVKGDVKDVMEITPQYEPVLGVFIDGVFSNKNITSNIRTGDIGKIIIGFHNTGGDGLIPLMSYSKKDVEIAGAAVIKKFRIVGELNGLENGAVEIMQNQMQGGSVVVKRKGVNVSIQIYSARTSRRLAVQNGKIYLILNSVFEGDVSGDILDRMDEVMTEQFVRDVQTLAEQKIKENVNHTVAKLKNYRVDVIGAGDLLSKYYPSIWEKVKDNWDDGYFPEVNVVIHPKVFLRRNGLVR